MIVGGKHSKFRFNIDDYCPDTASEGVMLGCLTWADEHIVAVVGFAEMFTGYASHLNKIRH